MRHALATVIALVLIAALHQVAASAAAPVDAAVPDAAQLSKVLGNAEAWTFQPTTYTLSGGSDDPALTAEPGKTLAVHSKESFGPGTEYRAVVRLRPTATIQATASLRLVAAVLPDKSVQYLQFHVRAAAGKPQIHYTLSLRHGKTNATTAPANLSLEPVGQRSLAWPEDLRKTIESQMASAPKLEDMHVILRCLVEENSARAYLNDRFVGELALPDGWVAAGQVQLQLVSTTELLSLQIAPLTQIDRNYEPIPLGGHLNSSALFKGQMVDRDALPGAGTGNVAVVGKTPFVIPAPDWRGNDHVDLGQSWTRFGALPGYFPAIHGQLGGRWTSADKIDPARICLYVPKGRYKALHLIAAADGDEHEVPVVTAQFYRPGAGHPLNFATSVPELSANAAQAQAIPVKTAEGTAVNLYHVVIPLEPDAFSWFGDLKRIGLELTKEVRYYRGYPDPLEYSWHAGGLPSSVHVYAATLERAGVDVDVQPEQVGHAWTAPAAPRYTVELRNTTGQATTAKLQIATRSHDGEDTTTQEQSVDLPAGDEPVKLDLALKPTRYGLHEMTLSLAAGEKTATYRRNFAYLHPDTRERGEWEQGKGPIFGFWAWRGGHVTPGAADEVTVMATAGAETSTVNYTDSPPEVTALAEKLHFISEMAFDSGAVYTTGFYYPWMKTSPEFDPANPDESGQRVIEALRKKKREPGPISRPTYVPFFAEPQIGPITSAIWPTHYGEGDYQFKPQEEELYQLMLAKYLAAARAVRKEWPDVKLLLPYGDPMVAVVFLKRAPETRGLIDGVAVDLPQFERLPELQMGQLVLNRMYPILKDLKEYIKDPYFVLVEGLHTSSTDIDTREQGQADVAIRNYLGLMGYGITRFESGNSPFDCAGGWGENHYGGGWCTRLPVAMPKLGYVHYATMTRHLNRANFVKYVPTGSHSTFCAQFKHYKTGKLIHVLWTVRGRRPVSVQVPAGATLTYFDPHDNAMELKENGGLATFTVDQSPRYLEGLSDDAAITLGDSDHSDAQPTQSSAKVGNLGDGSWKIAEQEDLQYAKNKPYQVERFLASMTVRTVNAPAAQGGKALAVHLEEEQSKDPGVMPYYTTIEPASAVEIPGKASHLGLWVHAASDWGRVVYCLRDAADERWISVGGQEEWNNDDIHGWSAFGFDGWRYLRFQLPAHAPYDNYREHGTSWWGSYGGDGVVDLPLRLERVIIERRPRVIYGTELLAAKPDDVLLGDLYAEYESASNMTEEAVQLSRLRMPAPAEAPELANPIAELAETGVGEPTTVTKVTDPLHQYDGTRCHVHFDLVPGAKSYDVWISPYRDGRGAIQLGKGWTESGKLIQGLRANVEFFAFVTYTDAEDKPSKPSQPLAFTLQDRFGYK